MAGPTPPPIDPQALQRLLAAIMALQRPTAGLFPIDHPLANGHYPFDPGAGYAQGPVNMPPGLSFPPSQPTGSFLPPPIPRTIAPDAPLRGGMIPRQPAPPAPPAPRPTAPRTGGGLLQPTRNPRDFIGGPVSVAQQAAMRKLMLNFLARLRANPPLYHPGFNEPYTPGPVRLPPQMPPPTRRLAM